MSKRSRGVLTAGCACLLGLLVAGGCATSTKMINTSPNPELEEVQGFVPLRATLYVRPASPEESTDADVAAALSEARVFRTVKRAAEGKGSPDLELVVSYSAESDTHFGSGMGKAIFSGLLLTIPDLFMHDEYDYSVTIDGTLLKDGNEVARYRGVGSYHSEVPEAGSVASAPKQTAEAVRLSWAHALDELVLEMMQDRETIEAALAAR